LKQMYLFQRGTLNAARTAIVGTLVRTQFWTKDEAGNFSSVYTDDVAPARTHDRQNEVTAVGGSTLAYDQAGQMTTDEQGRTLKWDAWGRLVEVDSGGSAIGSYKYDVLGRRITET